MSKTRHESREKIGDRVSVVVWWTVACDEDGCGFTAQGQNFYQEGEADAVLAIHLRVTHLKTE